MVPNKIPKGRVTSRLGWSFPSPLAVILTSHEIDHSATTTIVVRSTLLFATMGKEKDKKGGGSTATSNNVYVLDKDFAWIPARLIEQAGDVAKVSIPSYPSEEKILCDGGQGATSWREESVKLKFYPGKALPLQNVDKAGNLLEKEDMVDLPFLHEVRSG